ncbi:hypothetical protein AALP_AA8G372000 [Arabis alpina]|uniref:Uncharacterized protein n=1 Tax=Arabis alpina TaxID=50452 RepID=A0A087GBV1_ARAAL|nr:hypothetical protein AALP_AA8G372000 [Arabis alpina]
MVTYYNITIFTFLQRDLYAANINDAKPLVLNGGSIHFENVHFRYGESTKYYFLVANAKFMLDEEEHVQDQLFERLRHYREREKELDF